MRFTPVASNAFVVSERARLLEAAGDRPLRPAAVRWALGYLGYLGGMVALGFLALVLGILGLVVFVAILGGFLLGSSLAFLWRSARSGAEMALGREVTRAEAPGLHDEVVAVCGRLGIPVPGRIEVDDEPNACVFATKVGLFRYRAVLRVGLPLLELLRPDEARAVLAHECGHLARLDHVVGRLLHRLQLGWLAGVDGSAEGGADSPWWLRPFARYYWPRLQARLLASGRQAEEAADRVSIADVPGAAAAKVRAVVLSVGFSRFRDDHLRAANEASPELPEGLVSGLPGAFAEAFDADRARRHLRQLLHGADHVFDTHPTLARVLELARATGDDVPLDPPPRPEASAAAAWFEPASLAALRREQEQEWIALRTQFWREAHDRLRSARLQLGAAGDSEDLANTELRVRARLDLGQLREAAADLARLSDARPKEDGLARLAALAAALEDGDGARARVESTIVRFPQHALELYGALEAYHARRGEQELAQRTFALSIEHGDKVAEAQKERAVIDKKERLAPHRLEPDVLVRLRAALREQGDVVEARLASKVLKHFPDQPVHVLAVRFSGPARSSAKIREARVGELHGLSAPHLPERFLLNAHDHGPLWKQLGKLDGAVLFRKDGP